MTRHVAALLAAVMLFTVAFGTTGVTAFAAEPPAPVTISNTAELIAAIEAQKDDSTYGQTWVLSPGTYDLPRFLDAQVPKTETGGQDKWYFPIILDGLTIMGDGTGDVILTSSVWSLNGSWSSQDFISVWANGVTIQDVTIYAKRDTNKAIEVMGKDFTLSGATLLTNPDGPWEGYDYEKFSGSVYFNPQASVTGLAGNVGDSRIENVYIEGAWVSANAANVTTGTVSLNNVTIDWLQGAYAPWEPYGPISDNPLIIAEDDVKFLVDDSVGDLVNQITSKIPAGSHLQYFAAAAPDLELQGAVFTSLMDSGVYPPLGDLNFSFESSTTPGLYPYSWWFAVGTLDESYDTTFYPAVGVRTTVDTPVGDMFAAVDLPTNNYIIELDCAQSGALPGPASLTVFSNAALAGKDFSLYKYDPAGGTHLVDMSQLATVDEDGYVTVDIEDGDVWYLVSDPIVTNYHSIEGPNRFQTAVAAAEESFPDGAETVIIATGRNWPDALGGAALAGVYDAPILLVDTHSIPAEVSAEIAKLGATNAIILGETPAVGIEVASELAKTLDVERIGGRDRYETAEKIAARVIEKLDSAYSGDAFVATGVNFPDALAASPLAYGLGRPIYLVRPTSGAPITAMQAQGVTDVVILGSSEAVSSTHGNALAAVFATQRWEGSDRYATAASVATRAVNDLGMDWDQLAIATGQNFPDALAGGVVPARKGSVLLLTRTDSLPSITKTTLASHADQINDLYFLGGLPAISVTVRSEVAAQLR